MNPRGLPPYGDSGAAHVCKFVVTSGWAGEIQHDQAAVIVKSSAFFHERLECAIERQGVAVRRANPITTAFDVSLIQAKVLTIRERDISNALRDQVVDDGFVAAVER